MKKKETEEQVKERMIKYAASLGINLTVVDRLSDKNLFPEKQELANQMLAKTKFPDKK